MSNPANPQEPVQEQPPTRASGVLAYWQRLGLTGQVAFVAGLILLLSFFFLPWYTVSVSPFEVYTAPGANIGSYLWIILVAALGMIVLPLLGAANKLTRRQVCYGVLCAAVLALLIEIIYLFDVPRYLAALGPVRANVRAGPGYGFYLGLLLTLIAGVVSASELLRGKRASAPPTA